MPFVSNQKWHDNQTYSADLCHIWQTCDWYQTWRIHTTSQLHNYLPKRSELLHRNWQVGKHQINLWFHRSDDARPWGEILQGVRQSETTDGNEKDETSNNIVYTTNWPRINFVNFPKAKRCRHHEWSTEYSPNWLSKLQYPLRSSMTIWEKVIISWSATHKKQWRQHDVNGGWYISERL